MFSIIWNYVQVISVFLSDFQITQLEKKLEQLKQEKHELFSQLKKVLHQEDDTRKRAQQKE